MKHIDAKRDAVRKRVLLMKRDLGWSIRQISELIGDNASSVGLWLNGRRTGSTARVGRLVAGGGVQRRHPALARLSLCHTLCCVRRVALPEGPFLATESSQND